MTKILITGSAGFLGKYLFKQLSKEHDVEGIDINSSPYTTYQSKISLNILPFLDKTKPKIVIHCAALSHVDYCETHNEEAYQNNVETTRILVEWARRNNAKMIFISSDYVYAGETNNYDEKSPTNPLNYYGKNKLEGEALVSSLDNYCILRPTVLFGLDPGGKNFLMQMLELKEKRKIPFDQISNPTDMKILVDYIEGTIKKDIQGTFVATGPETIGRYDFALKIAKHLGLDGSLLVSVPTSELGQTAKRPLNNGTDSSLIRNVLKYHAPSLDESLKRMANEQKKIENS